MLNFSAHAPIDKLYSLYWMVTSTYHVATGNVTLDFDRFVMVDGQPTTEKGYTSVTVKNGFVAGAIVKRLGGRKLEGSAIQDAINAGNAKYIEATNDRSLIGRRPIALDAGHRAHTGR